MKKISKLLSLSIALSMLCNPAIAQETIGQKGKKVYERTIDTVVNKLQHLKGCLQGRDTCSKADFAILGTGLLFLYGALRGIRWKIITQVPAKVVGIPVKKPVDKGLTYPDPVYWGEKITKVPGTIKRKIFPGKRKGAKVRYTESN